MDIDKLKSQLIAEEGSSRKLYQDTRGIWTIGVGHNIQDNGISDAVLNLILQEDIAAVTADLDLHLPWWRSEDDVRQRVLADLCFNMGINVLLGFHKCLAAWQATDHETAANELEGSIWFHQVGNRGPKLVHMLRTGKEA